jgi:hypothetical protein
MSIFWFAMPTEGSTCPVTLMRSVQLFPNPPAQALVGMLEPKLFNPRTEFPLKLLDTTIVKKILGPNGESHLSSNF